jgi:hypothetical protein
MRNHVGIKLGRLRNDSFLPEMGEQLKERVPRILVGKGSYCGILEDEDFI